MIDKLLALSILLFVKTNFAYQQERPATMRQTPKALSLCDLIRDPDKFTDKVVTLSTTLNSGPESFEFADDACKPTPDQPDVIADVTYSKEYKFETRLQKKLHRLLKKSHSAQITAIGLFVDGKGRDFGRRNCFRYLFEMQELVAVDPVNSPGTR